MREKSLAAWIIIAVLVLSMVLIVGCTPSAEHESSTRKYMLVDLQSYSVAAESPVEVVHWFNINHVNPGLFHLFYNGDLYIMATYDGINYLGGYNDAGYNAGNIAWF